MVVLAAAIVLIPQAPLGLITTAVQALAGIMLPSATVFAVLLCNDRAVLGPWVNRPWLNAIAGVIVSAMLVLSLILVISTVIPSVDVTTLLFVLGSLAAVILVLGGGWSWVRDRGAPPEPEISREERENWRHHRDYWYFCIVPVDGFRHGLFVEMELSDDDPDVPEVALVNAHPEAATSAPVQSPSEPPAPAAPEPAPAAAAATDDTQPRKAGWWSRRFGGGE